MGAPNDAQNASGKSEVTRVSTRSKLDRGCSITSGPYAKNNPILKSLTKLNHGKLGRGVAGPAASFLVKVAALVIVRRISRARCPVVWSGLQALQVFCYPPLKWIQRWNPFGFLVNGLETLSRPLLVLSLATAFSEHEDTGHPSSSCDESNDIRDPNRESDSYPEAPSAQSNAERRADSEVPKAFSSSNWLVQLHEELKNQCVTLPERINEEELSRFYSAANGDFSCFISSVKKTIIWRNNYRILPVDELDMWSTMVFWHGSDINSRPCLVIRLGLAFSTLPPDQRPRFAQAVVSQVEYGVLHLVAWENPQISVLVDCEGLSPFKIPMQLLKSCSTLLQDHFPNRLGCLFIIRLPPVARVIFHTFLKILRPITRKKLKIEGNMYRKTLAECFQTLPSYLGGVCTCTVCVDHNMSGNQHSRTIRAEHIGGLSEGFPLPDPINEVETLMDENYNQLVRMAIISILIFSVVIAFFAGISDPESRPVFPAAIGSSTA